MKRARTPAAELVLIRVPVVMTRADRDRLVAHCEDEVRSVGSWFRWAIRRAWRSRKPPRRQPDELLRVDPTLRNRVAVWARLTETERGQLEVLCADEGVAPSIWFRRRLAAHLGEVAPVPARRSRRG